MTHNLAFPLIYLLSWNFAKEPGSLYQLETELGEHLVFTLKEAEVVIGKVYKKARAQLELRKLGVETEDATIAQDVRIDNQDNQRSRKRRKLLDDKVEGIEVINLDDTMEYESEGSKPRPKVTARTDFAVNTTTKHPSTNDKIIRVLKFEWYIDSVKAGKVLPTEAYLVYEGRIIPAKRETKSSPQPVVLPSSDILARARADTAPRIHRQFNHEKPKFGGSQGRTYHSQSQNHTVPLLHQSTTEHEIEVPPIPDCLHTRFSCERATLANGANEEFIAQLRIIKKARTIQQDMIGIRSYSAGIATLAAYPHTITSTDEIQGLPNLGLKFAVVWKQWKDTGHIAEIDVIEASEEMKALNIFWEIFDVAGATAHAFYQKGWKDLDDVIEFGWDTLTRNQQIGVKFYDDFLVRIPRPEVERIGKIINDHALEIREGYQMVICGGYRRGKKDSGDVDVVISHPDEEATLNFLDVLLANLERGGYVTHRLKNSTTNSDRGQNPLKWRGSSPRHAWRSGFDTLDHCFCVWQDPVWPGQEANPDAKNPNVHRRVDIIISPWKTAGCAVLGWSGANMFERDLRGYCRAKHGMKFDSSGCRKVDDGTWVDMEGWEEGFAGNLLAKEKRIFEKLGLEWREPTERCTD